MTGKNSDKLLKRLSSDEKIKSTEEIKGGLLGKDESIKLINENSYMFESNIDEFKRYENLMMKR